jgi:hypothetical protein
LFFLLFGDGIDQSNTALMELVERNGLNGSIILGGRSDDVAASYSAMDLLVSSSRGEAFSNVICEGMLCELPCIVTNVGDSAAIAGDTGYIVAPSRPYRCATPRRRPRAARSRCARTHRHEISRGKFHQPVHRRISRTIRRTMPFIAAAANGVPLCAAL